MDNNIYRTKYIKYKKKYLELKKLQRGGVNNNDIIIKIRCYEIKHEEKEDEKYIGSFKKVCKFPSIKVTFKNEQPNYLSIIKTLDPNININDVTKLVITNYDNKTIESRKNDNINENYYNIKKLIIHIK